MKMPRVILILAITSMFSVLAQTAEADRVRAIVGATVVDLDGGEPIRNAVVLIQGEEITAVGNATTVEVPATAEVIDAKGTWLIPGLMNMHVHLGLILPGKLAAELANETEAELALRMAASAREVLLACPAPRCLRPHDRQRDVCRDRRRHRSSGYEQGGGGFNPGTPPPLDPTPRRRPDACAAVPAAVFEPGLPCLDRTLR